MPKLNILPSLLFSMVILLLSCKKTDVGKETGIPPHSGIYDAAKEIQPSPMAIYTMTGKITDQAFIREVVQRKVSTSILLSYNFPGIPNVDQMINYSPQPVIARDTFNVNFSDSGRISINYYHGTQHFTEQVSNDPFVILKEIDSTDHGPFTGISEKLYKPDGEYSCMLISSTGNNYWCRTRQVYGIGYENGKLYVPYACVLAFNSGGDFYTWGNISFRFINDDAINFLNVGDTIIVQENRRELIIR